MAEKTDPHIAHPLRWPEGRPRTRRPQRARFDQTFGTARTNLLEEIKRLGGSYPVISSNVETRRDGLPYASRPGPEDAGVAVYFTYQGRQVCFACDKWDRVRDNLQAVAKTIEALRGIDRWGPGDMVERAFAGFEALPPPESAGGTDWRQVLGTQTLSLEVAEHTARGLLHRYHPDRETGDRQRYQLVLWAREQARQELGREAGRGPPCAAPWPSPRRAPLVATAWMPPASR